MKLIMRLIGNLAGNLIRFGILLAVMVSPSLLLMKLATWEFGAIAQSNNDLRSQQITEAVYLKQSGYDRLQKGDPQGAIVDLQKALELFRKWQATGGELDTLNFLGDVYLTTGRYEQALPYFQQALVIAQNQAKLPDGDPVYVGYTLQYIADVYDKQRQYEQALPIYQQALGIFRDRLKSQKGDRDSLLSSERLTLSRMASIYFKSSQYDLALNSYRQMLANSIAPQDIIGRVQILNNIGVIYANRTEYAQALESYEQALALVRTLCCYRGDEAAIINNLSALYYSLGQNRRALALADQATKIYFSLTDVGGLQKTEIELLHDVLGEDNSNPTLTSRGLSVRATVGDTANDNVTVKAGQANNLNNIAQLYSNSGKYQDALSFFQKAKVIYQEIGNDLGMGITLDNLGSTYTRLGQFEQAIAFHQQALTQYEKVKDQAGRGVAMSNIGRAYANLGKKTEAIQFYQKALKIARDVSDRSTESVLLANIGDLLAQQKQFAGAIAYLKAAINVREGIRQSIRMLPREDRSAYKQSVSYTYRNLAKLLLQQNRINEAIQVLDLLKVQELQDYLRDVKGNERTANGITLFKAEQKLINADIKELLNPLNNESSIVEIQAIAAQESQNLATSRSLLANVQKFGDRSSLFYPLLFEDQLFLVLLPAKSAPVLRSIKVKSEEITKLIQNFRADLQDSGSLDIKDSSTRLYQYLIKPIEADLQAANIELLLYAPDGQLRYIPLAALYDGKNWLVERYSFNYLTASGFLDFQNFAPNSLKIMAAAFTQGSINFEIGNEKFTFSGLPFAGKEIDRIVATFPDTKTLTDNLFNREAIVSQVSNYGLVHLATHAAFVRGTPEDSFVLMGNGERLNLRELREWKLPNTQLVVLSACQTAIGGVVGSGEEILGFGYQIQRTGAKAAIASLWTVSDQGTQLLMGSFYAQLKKGSNIINALRQAQLGLLRSSQTELQHPYFWSSFILIGNGK